MTTFDQRGQVIKGVQLNTGGKFIPMTNYDPAAMQLLMVKLGIDSVTMSDKPEHIIIGIDGLNTEMSLCCFVHTKNLQKVIDELWNELYTKNK